MKGYCDRCGVPIRIPVALPNPCGPEYGVREGCVRYGSVVEHLAYFVFGCKPCGGVNEFYRENE